VLKSDDVVDGRPLAFARIGIGLSGFLNCIEAWLTLGAVVDQDAVRMQTWGWLPAVTPLLGGTLAGIGVMASVFVVVGLGTRPAAALLAASLGSMMLLEQQAYRNHLVLTCWCALWLMLSHADARWSLRARIEGAQHVRLSDQVLLMTQLSVVYAFTGLLKINPEFLSGRVIQGHSPFDLPDWMAQLMAMGAVLTEISLAVGLWLARARWAVALAGLSLHVAIPVVMYQPVPLVSFSIGILVLYPLFFARRIGDRRISDMPVPTSVTA
jgi:hypothetical protein